MFIHKYLAIYKYVTVYDFYQIKISCKINYNRKINYYVVIFTCFFIFYIGITVNNIIMKLKNVIITLLLFIFFPRILGFRTHIIVGKL